MELGLNRARVDVVFMQYFADLRRNNHVVHTPVHADVHRGNDLGLGELPDVQLVQGRDAVYAPDVLPELIERDRGGYPL